MKVSVIATVRDEDASIDDLIRSLLAQSRQPDEIVFSDGGSRDATVPIIQRWIARGAAIRLIECPGANIAVGRNRAIDKAAGDVIACTDAGARLDPQWLSNLIAPFANGAEVVMGFFVGAPESAFERAVVVTTLPEVDEIRPDRFIPSSRSVAFTRNAWKRVGGYPEWLDYCEDVVFDLALRAAGFRFAWAPTAVVYYRPRPSLPEFFRQYYLYARGDGKANLWPRRHAIRYTTYLGALLVACLGFWYKRAWIALALGAMIHLWIPSRRLVRSTAEVNSTERVGAMAFIPMVRVTGDVAKMIGYPVGVWWRLRRGKSSG